MPKVLDNPFAKWASAIAIVVSVCSLVAYCFKARAYVDDKVKELDQKTSATYATKESVQSMKTSLETVERDTKDILKAIGRLEGRTYGYGPHPQK